MHACGGVAARGGVEPGGAPRVAEALAAGEISESVARTLCLWTDKLPAERRADADKILADAAVSGLGLADLAGLFAEIYERSRAGEPDEDKDESFEDRALRLVTTLGGAGVLHGDLTPECGGAVQAVLDALSAPAGAEDTRTREQRCHRRCRAPADTSRAWEAIEQAVIGKPINFYCTPDILSELDICPDTRWPEVSFIRMPSRSDLGKGSSAADPGMATPAV